LFNYTVQTIKYIVRRAEELKGQQPPPPGMGHHCRAAVHLDAMVMIPTAARKQVSDPTNSACLCEARRCEDNRCEATNAVKTTAVETTGGNQCEATNAVKSTTVMITVWAGLGPGPPLIMIMTLIMTLIMIIMMKMNMKIEMKMKMEMYIHRKHALYA